MPKVLVAIAWLRREDWPKWLAMDPNFQPDYDKWLSKMQSLITELEKRGASPERVEVDPDKFLEWSGINGGKVDTKARSAYAAFRLNAQRTGH